MSADRSVGRLDRPAAPYPAIEPEQRVAARVVGFLYIFQMATAVFGQSFVRDSMIIRGDAVRSAQNILAHERLFRLSIAGDLITYTGVIVLMWALYVVVRPIHRNLALLAVLFRVAETAVLCVATVNSLVVLKLLKGATLETFTAGQRSSLAALAIQTQGLGMSVGFVLLGLGSTVFAYLLWKSRYVPRALAALGIFSSLVLAFVTLAILAFPGLGETLGIAYMGPMGIYEVGLGLWLLIRGIRTPPAAPASAAAATAATAATE